MSEGGSQRRKQGDGDRGWVASEFVRRGFTALLLALAGVLVIAVVWIAADVLLVVFAGVLFGVFLLALRDIVARYTPLPPGWSLALVVTILFVLATGGFALLVPILGAQIDELGQRLPAIVSEIEAFLQQFGWGQQLLERLEQAEPDAGIAAGLGAVLGGTVQWGLYLIALLFIGLFLAINPDVYQSAVVNMMPLERRSRARQVLDEMGYILRWFLVARAIAMLLVGVSTAIALLLLGVPLAILLGVVAGLLTFVPYLGPVIAGVPIVIIALLESPALALWALIIYTAIQQVEGNLFDPLILQRVIHLPPAFTVLAQLLGSTLMGVLGLALATPFAAVLQVFIRRVHREGVLGEPESDVARDYGEE